MVKDVVSLMRNRGFGFDGGGADGVEEVDEFVTGFVDGVHGLVDVFGVEGSLVESWVEDLVLFSGDLVGFFAGEELSELIDEALFGADPFVGHFAVTGLAFEPLDLLAHDVIPMAGSADDFAGDLGSVGGTDDALFFFAGAVLALFGDGFSASGAEMGLWVFHIGS
jgi:hypothetical protein